MIAIRENGTTLLATYEYDQLGRRDRLVLGNGAVTDYHYDAVSRLDELRHDLGGLDTTNDNTIAFAHNPAGQIVRREASNSAYSWTNHFNAGAGSTFDGLNRPTGDAHDARSNRSTDGIRTYAYDSENKGRGVAAAPWHYDPLGRLSGASTSPGAPPAIAYESYVDNLVAERVPGSSTVSRRHVFGPGVDEPIVWYEGSSRRFLQADERGSIVAVTSDAGALLAINRYDEYGQTESTSNAHSGRFLYTGQRYFGGFGLYHYKNRIYDPKVGRFMQPDPIGYEGGMNLYAYVGADPVNFTDPLGWCGSWAETTSDGYYRGYTGRCEGEIGFIGGAEGGITFAANRFLSAAAIVGGLGDGGGGELAQCEPAEGQIFPDARTATILGARATAVRNNQNSRAGQLQEFHANVQKVTGGYAFTLGAGRKAGGRVPIQLNAKSSYGSAHNHESDSEPAKQGYLSNPITNRDGRFVQDSDVGSYHIFFDQAEKLNPGIRKQLHVALAIGTKGGRIYYWKPGSSLSSKGADVGPTFCEGDN